MKTTSLRIEHDLSNKIRDNSCIYIGAVPGAGVPGGGAGLRPGGAQLQLPPHLGGSRARRGAALDIYVCRDLLYYNIWAQ